MLNNKWYAIDVTWDDPTIIGSGRVPTSTKTRYFLVMQIAEYYTLLI